ncbi:MAG TPA: hypothetical protein VKV80_08675, partial [Streptosporangiaceae bacterium]|nr:hypothetical protein [Streptosporangiaceae bacterium]
QPGHPPRQLLWPQASTPPARHTPHTPPPAARVPGRYQLHGFTFFAHLVPDTAVPALLPGTGWHRAEPVRGSDGRPVAAIWQHQDGSVFLPFDPGEAMHQFWSESYRTLGRSPLAAAARAAVLRGYYLTRPALPRPLQIRLRRSLTRIQARSTFPAWPLDDSLHHLYEWLFTLTARLAGRPVPYLAPWPAGHTWALVLTHDVETAAGCHNIHLLREAERRLGYRSAWNFVPHRYQVTGDTLRALRAEGCEIGVHGLRHDGRDLASRKLLDKRLPVIRAYARHWGADGFRSPATQRAWDLMPRLGFAYDSSYPDTDPYEPQPGGCCTCLPYFNRNLVELPITLPQDHTLYTILATPDTTIWTRKARQLRDRHAMALTLTHPDYAHDPRVTTAYTQLLRTFAADSTAWHALPADVAAWWRHRAASTLHPHGTTWAIHGPAATTGRIWLAEAG